MSIADKLSLIARNEQKVYDAGKDAQWNAFWDAYQQNGERTTYGYAFYQKGWTPETFKPKYNIVSSGASQANYVFAHSAITEIPVRVDLSGCNELRSTFYNCQNLRRIAELTVSENSPFLSGTFGLCSALEEINLVGTADGVIDFSACPNLTAASLLSVIDALRDYSSEGGTHVCTLGQTNLDKLSAAEKAVAENKGWTLE